MCGDIDIDAVSGKVQAVTPVPGGVGGVTSAVLLRHLIEAAENSVTELLFFAKHVGAVTHAVDVLIE